ncbi:chaperone modulator CbpM [Flavobacterium sp. N1994]|uniref:chaperone modulator CbpM n=1 Tax=Flavobacterium sp. N1994 TaxID=2986827 RepID=UPI002223DF61|nr:chaperone modulator CbpM [Flavobacterium sp. N1994]
MNSDDLIVIDLFCLHHGIEVDFIFELQSQGMIDIVEREEKKYFSVAQLVSIEKIIRLHYDLNINLEGIDVIMNLLHQMEEYQRQLQIAKNKLAFFEEE